VYVAVRGLTGEADGGGGSRIDWMKREATRILEYVSWEKQREAGGIKKNKWQSDGGND
jgi:hypothetical protein